MLCHHPGRVLEALLEEEKLTEAHFHGHLRYRKVGIKALVTLDDTDIACRALGVDFCAGM